MCERRADAEKQTKGFSGSRSKGFTAVDGGRIAAEAAFKKHLETPPKPKDSVSRVTKGGITHASPHIQNPSKFSAALSSTVPGSTSQVKRRYSHLSENDRLPKSRRLTEHFQASDYKENEENLIIPRGDLGKAEKPQAKLEPEYIDLDTWNASLQRSEPANDYIALEEPIDGDEFEDKFLDETFARYEMIQRNSERPLCQEQIDLIELILTGRNVFYTGSAGCGKSTVLNCFRQCLREMSKRVFIIAPTGRAALDINGVTFWSYAGWTPDSMKRSIRELEKNATKKRVKKRLEDTDVLVIDEISMMENQHFERLNRIMRVARGRDEAFGGVQLIVTGDYCQLPPVKPFQFCLVCGKSLVNVPPGTRRCADHGNVYTQNLWAFCSNAWKECDFVNVYLHTIHRQSDIDFITLLGRLRLGKPLMMADRDLLLNHESNTEGAVKLFPTRRQVDKVNLESFASLSTDIFTFTCHDHFDWKEQPDVEAKGQRNLDGSLKALSEHRYSRSIDLRAGMLVVLLVNVDIAAGLVNGSQGTILRFEKLETTWLPEQKGSHKDLKSSLIRKFTRSADQMELPVVQFTNGRETTIFPDCNLSEVGEVKPFSLISRTQVPLMAAWAMTVHKSQGMTLDRVIVDLADSFEEGQVYVALSRARSLEGLKVERLPMNDIGCNRRVRHFLRTTFGIE